MNEKSRSERYQELCRLDDGPHVASTIRFARQLLQSYPDHGPAWAILGNNLTSIGHYAEAEAALHKSLELCPPKRSDVPLVLLGHLFRESGNYELAIDWYRKAVAAGPHDAGNYIYLGAMLAKAGRFEEAESAHRQATQCSEGCIDEAHLNLGFVLRSQGRFQEAAECFKMAIQLDPSYEEATAALKDVEQCMQKQEH